jgi:hypothetical protein
MTLRESGGTLDDGALAMNKQTLTYTLGTKATLFSTVASNTMTLDTFINPNVPGNYPIAVTFFNGATAIGRKTVYF